MFEHFGPQADVAGSRLLTAFGYDWVPGNLAGAFALRDAGPGAVRVDIGYFNRGGGISGGTRASAIGAALEPSFAFRGGRLRSERTGARARSFVVDPDTTRWAMSVGGTEHFALPALYPGLRDVDVLLAAPGLTATRAMPALSLALAAATRLGPLKNGLQTLVERRIEGSTGGPDAATRAHSSSVIIAKAFSASDDLKARTRLEGVDAYTFTGTSSPGPRPPPRQAGFAARARWDQSRRSVLTNSRLAWPRRACAGCLITYAAPMAVVSRSDDGAHRAQWLPA